jgi:HlyD family secretion protein
MTKRRFFWLLTAVAFLGAFWVGYQKLHAQWNKSAADLFREGTVRRGDIKYEVKCTGTVQPVLSVQVGAFVSGPIRKVCVDFNDKVTKDQLLAEIDPQVYEAQIRQAKSVLNHSLADLEQCKAKRHQTELEFKRAKELHNMSGIPGINHAVKAISESDYDLAEVNYEMAAATVNLAQATVEQNEALLDMAKTNLGYTLITSPVDGIIIDRKVDAGQTLASQYQTPVMFVVAPELEKKVWILASIDEADIGLVRKAESNKQPVQFTIDAYQEEKFEGKIIQVRLGPKAAQPNMSVNVVTYVAVVEAPNTELKLLPGMTANLVFRIDQHDKVLKIPNAALRFHPKPEFVHPKHLAVLEGLKSEEEAEESGAAKKQTDDEAEESNSGAKDKTGEKNGESADDPPSGAKQKTAEKGDENKSGEKKKADDKARPKGNLDAPRKRYVWIIDGNLLAPVEVTVGLSDARRTELVSGGLKDGSKVVTGMKTAAEAAAGKSSQK